MEKITILLLANDKDSGKDIKNILLEDGYNIILVTSAFDALNYCIKDIINLLIIDITVNKNFGLEVVDKFREYSLALPILVLTNRNDIESKIIAFNSGANDLLVKPFNLFEFKARVTNQLKTSTEEHHEVFNNGELSIDYDKRLVMINNREVHLTNLEYKILVLLSMNLDKVLTYDYIIEKIWGKGGQDNNGLRVFVSNIRNKLKIGKRPYRFIRTQVRTGYRMKKAS